MTTTKRVLLVGKITKRDGRVMETRVKANGYGSMTQQWGKASTIRQEEIR